MIIKVILSLDIFSFGSNFVPPKISFSYHFKLVINILF
jgi:hypothetical protein